MSHYPLPSPSTAHIPAINRLQPPPLPRSTRQQPLGYPSDLRDYNPVRSEVQERGIGENNLMEEMYSREGSLSANKAVAQLPDFYERRGGFLSFEDSPSLPTGDSHMAPLRHEPSGTIGDAMSSPTSQFGFHHTTRHLQPEQVNQDLQHIAASNTTVLSGQQSRGPQSSAAAPRATAPPRPSTRRTGEHRRNEVLTENPEDARIRDLNDDRGVSVEEESNMDRKGRIGLKVFADFLANEIYEREITHPNSTHSEFLLAIKCYLFTTMPFPTPADTILWIDGWTKRRGISRIRQLYRDMIEDNLTKARGNYVSYVRSQVKTAYNLGSTVPEIKKNVDFWLQDRHFLFARIDPGGGGKKGKFQHPAAKSIIADYFYHPNALGDLCRRKVDEEDVEDPFGHHERAIPAPIIALTFTAIYVGLKDWSTGVQIRPSQAPFTRKQRPKYTKFLESLERHQDYDDIRTEAYTYAMEHGGLLEVGGATSSEDADSDY